ncbi:MAG: hypothetical protein P8Z39_01970 [Gammaproteobacteria bacterium]
MQIENRTENLPEVEFLPRIHKAPSRLNCKFGWGDVTTREFQQRDFEKLVLVGGPKQNFCLPDLGEKARRLKSLSLEASGCVEGIEQFANLESLDVVNLPKNGITLSAFKRLISVFSERNKSIEEQIAQCPMLKLLGLVGFSGSDCAPFAPLSELREIAFTQGRLQSLNGIGGCHQLEYVALAYLRNLTDISALKSLDNLAELSLSSLPKIVDTLVISDYKKLQSLYLVNSKLVTDLSGISKNTKLKRILLNTPYTNLDWDELFRLQHLLFVSLTVGNSSPSDQEIHDMAARSGRIPLQIERIGKGKKTNLRVYFEGWENDKFR